MNGWNTAHHQINTKLVPVNVGIKLFMQIGWSYRVGSIKGDLDRKLHSALIRQPAAMLNKWKCIPFHSFPPVCLCALRHPEEFNRTLILHLIFTNSPLLSLPVSLPPFPLHLSSHADSLSHRIPTVVSNQGNHSQRATNRSLIWCLVWSDRDRQPVKSLASASLCYF